MRVRFARSARRHRIAKADIEHVIVHSGLYFEQPPPPDRPGREDPRLVFLGDGRDGAPLEVVAIELGEDELLVIHAMPLRERYRDQYEEAARWRR